MVWVSVLRLRNAKLTAAKGYGGRASFDIAQVVSDFRVAVNTYSPQFGQHLVQRLTLNVLHGIEERFTVLADLEDRHNVCVVKPSGSAGLTTKAAQGSFVSRQLPREHFQRNTTPQRLLFSLVDYSHRAATDLLQDAIVPHSLQPLESGVTDGRPRSCLQVDGARGDFVHQLQRREQISDLVGQVRMLFDVLVNLRRFAATATFEKIIGQDFQRVSICTRRIHRDVPFRIVPQAR